jgi:hypothetical protein
LVRKKPQNNDSGGAVVAKQVIINFFIFGALLFSGSVWGMEKSSNSNGVPVKVLQKKEVIQKQEQVRRRARSNSLVLIKHESTKYVEVKKTVAPANTVNKTQSSYNKYIGIATLATFVGIGIGGTLWVNGGNIKKTMTPVFATMFWGSIGAAVLCSCGYAGLCVLSGGVDRLVNKAQYGLSVLNRGFDQLVNKAQNGLNSTIKFTRFHGKEFERLAKNKIKDLGNTVKSTVEDKVVPSILEGLRGVKSGFLQSINPFAKRDDGKTEVDEVARLKEDEAKLKEALKIAEEKKRKKEEDERKKKEKEEDVIYNIPSW